MLLTINSLHLQNNSRKTSGIIQPGLTNKNPALREVDLELSTKTATDRTKVSLTDCLKDCL